MRTLNRYLTEDFLVIFFLTLTVITFVMCLGAVLKVIDFASRGVSGMLIVKMFLLNIPYMFTFSIPMSVLTAVLLLFGRLSFDGEITAMRASGVNLVQIVAPVVLLSIVLSLVCLFISSTVAPRCRNAIRDLFSEVRAEDPISLLEPGRYIRDFPGLLVKVGSRDGNEVTDIVVYEMSDVGTPQRIVRAESGQLRADAEAKAFYIDLYKVQIDQMEQDLETGASKSHYVNADYYPVKMDLARLQRKRTSKKVADMSMTDLAAGVRNVREIYPELTAEDLEIQRMHLVVEANKRLALSLSCFAFTLLGVPLAMKSKRKESSIGVAYSLAGVFIFYLFIILANSLVSQPELHPDLIVWLPVLAAELGGLYLIWKTK